MLGIIFGVGAVISMLSIGAGAQAEALKVIDSMEQPSAVLHDDPSRCSADPKEIMTTFISRLEAVRRDTTDLNQNDLIRQFIKRMRRASDDLNKII